MMALMSSSSSSEEFRWSGESTGLAIQGGERERPRRGLVDTGECCRPAVVMVRAPNAASAEGGRVRSREAPACLP